MSEPWLLAVDTATTRILVAAGASDGRLLGADVFEGRYRHSQELMPAVVRLLDGLGLRLPDLAGIIAGTGPGAFTGLRVGIATAKTLAHELGVPMVGIATDVALLDAAGPNARTLWLPSGPRDLVRVERGVEPTVVHGAGADVIGADGDAAAVAVDLDGRAPEEALAKGRAAVDALAASLVRLGAARLAAGDVDDPERLVPRYASPPRGMPAGNAEGGVAWSRDPR